MFYPYWLVFYSKHVTLFFKVITAIIKIIIIQDYSNLWINAYYSSEAASLQLQHYHLYVLHNCCDFAFKHCKKKQCFLNKVTIVSEMIKSAMTINTGNARHELKTGVKRGNKTKR